MNKALSLELVGEALQLAGAGSSLETPKILLAATDRWVPTARMGMALANAGCLVDAVCPSHHPLGMTRAVRQTYDYNGLRPLTSFIRAIRAASPDLIIPADDLATWHLHDIYNQDINGDRSGLAICKLIESSLGAGESFKIVRARNAFMQVAKEVGVRVPQTEAIADLSGLHDWIVRMGFPTVLKANGTSGGDGVKVVNTVEEAERAFRKLQAPPLLARAVKRAVVDRDLTLLRPSVSRRKSVVNAQAFVTGYEATSAIACWKGKVLASLHFEVIEKVGSTGHATVIRRIDHSEMTAAAKKISQRLKLSGIHGLDFMIEAKTGNAYLIEINPRTPQVGHLALGGEHDLPAALYRAVTGQDVEPVSKITENDTIALFPQEWRRDPSSPFLSSGYHDVPWEEPLLVSSCLSKVPKQWHQVPQRLQQATPSPVSTTPAVKSGPAGSLVDQE